ncbi:hypothetical protein H9P43_004362 [Blastocladiella emersonii ATCC 22665]|nr:hypothetical protein H9P43_004362 [Blastocladiella emersonii ATCC 22665]
MNQNGKSSRNGPPGLEAFVSPATFRPLPNPLPLDVAVAKHLSPAAAQLKRSFTMHDLADQSNPVEFCHTFRCYKLLEDYTRTTLQATPAADEHRATIMTLWYHRIESLIRLDLIGVALAESKALDLPRNPLASWGLRILAARLPALGGDAYLSVDLFHRQLTALAQPGVTSLAASQSARVALEIRRQLVTVVAHDLHDPRLLDQLIASFPTPETSECVPATLVAAWWADLALVATAVSLFPRAEAFLAKIDALGTEYAGLANFVRGTLLAARGSHPQASRVWDDLVAQLKAASERIRAFEAANPDAPPALGDADETTGAPAPMNAQLRVSDSLPTLLADLPASDHDATPPHDALVPTAAEYAADLAWIAPLLPLVDAIANNAIVARQYTAPDGAMAAVNGESSALDQLTAVARRAGYTGSAVVSNLAAWIEVTPPARPPRPPATATTVLDRKRDELVAMIRATDAPAVAAMRMG